MKLIELKDVETKGTYMACKFTSDTIARLKKFVKDNEIPNGLEAKDFHTTIIYSRKEVDIEDEAGKLKDKWVGKPDKLEIFKTANGWNALVLRYSCPEMVKVHDRIMKDTDATYDYPEYKVHVTLSYNIEDYDQKKLLSLPLEKIGEILVDSLYVEELNLNFAASTIKK